MMSLFIKSHWELGQIMNLKASVNYHIESNEPQAFLFDADGVEGNLIPPKLLSTTIDVKDLRTAKHSVDFNKKGIAFEIHKSRISSFNKENNWQATYNEEIEVLLRNKINALDVLVFDHTVRIDDLNAVRKPARNVHNDYTRKSAEKRLIDLLGKQKAAEYQQGSYAFVNVWRPIEHTITTSPLGFIDPHSMQDSDWVDIQLVYPDRRGEILGVKPNTSHAWFYQSNMTPDEVIIFNIYDNKGRPHLAHSALDLVENSETKAPRKSIETRTLVRYA